TKTPRWAEFLVRIIAFCKGTRRRPVPLRFERCPWLEDCLPDRFTDRVGQNSQNVYDSRQGGKPYGHGDPCNPAVDTGEPGMPAFSHLRLTHLLGACGDRPKIY